MSITRTAAAATAAAATILGVGATAANAAATTHPDRVRVAPSSASWAVTPDASAWK